MIEAEVEKFLKNLQVRFIIIGGMAAIAQGSAYLTADIDFWYSRDKGNLENLARASVPFHTRLRDAAGDLPFKLDAATLSSGLNFTLSTDFGDVDIFGAGLGAYEQTLAFSEELDLFGIPCGVLTLEGLIRSKQAAGRAKDLRLLPELKALQAIRRSQK